MNPNWYDELVLAETEHHDRNCFAGAECHVRELHTYRDYVAPALRQRYESELALRVVLDERFPCDGLCASNGSPEEDCSRHGRSPAQLWEMIARYEDRVTELQIRRDELRDERDNLAVSSIRERHERHVFERENRALRERHMTTADPARLRMEGTWIVEEVDRHTCGTGPSGHFGAHEPGCGLEPVLNVADVPHWEHTKAEILADYERTRVLPSIRVETTETVTNLLRMASRDAFDEGWRGATGGYGPMAGRNPYGSPYRTETPNADA